MDAAYTRTFTVITNHYFVSTYTLQEIVLILLALK